MLIVQQLDIRIR